MTAYLESAGLHVWTISMLVSIEVCGLFIHLLIEVLHFLIIHSNDLVLLAVVILITCHCRHCKCDCYHHGCDHFILLHHNLLLLNCPTFVLCSDSYVLRKRSDKSITESHCKSTMILLAFKRIVPIRKGVKP